jgi:hypothetical protein
VAITSHGIGGVSVRTSWLGPRGRQNTRLEYTGMSLRSVYSPSNRGRGRMGRWSTATPKDFPVERMTRRCAAPKITQIQRRFESSRFAADIALLI